MKYDRVPKPIRYIISGGSGAVVNLGTLYALTHIVGVWYLTASVIAFILSFVVSFTLQRIWTFDIRTRDGIARHGVLYLFVALGNLLFNTAFVYLLVEYLQVWYLLAQLLSGMLIALVSFFVYRKIFV